MTAVVSCEADNRMNAGAVTAVLAPVLMRGAVMSSKDEANADPLAALTAAQSSVKLAAALLASHGRSRLRGRGHRLLSAVASPGRGSSGSGER